MTNSMVSLEEDGALFSIISLRGCSGQVPRLGEVLAPATTLAGSLYLRRTDGVGFGYVSSFRTASSAGPILYTHQVTELERPIVVALPVFFNEHSFPYDHRPLEALADSTDITPTILMRDKCMPEAR